MNGIRSLLTVLSPREVLSICSTTEVLVPVLVVVPVKVVVLVVSAQVFTVCVPKIGLQVPVAPCHPIQFPPLFVVLVLVVSTKLDPVQTVCQEPHTVGANPVCGSTPNLLEASAITDAKLPSALIVLASSLCVDTQVSDDGTSSRVPCQKVITKGVTFSVLVAYLCANHTTSE